MTIQHVIDVLDTFRDEYNSSSNRDVRRMCNFVQSSIDGLNAYLIFFTRAKKEIEYSQAYYEGALDTIDNLIVNEDGTTPELPPGDDDVTLDEIIQTQEDTPLSELVGDDPEGE